MRHLTVAAALLAAAALAGCSSASTSTASGSSPSSSPPPAATSPAPSASASLTCADLAKVATTLTSKVHYVALDVGTDNDPSTYYAAIDEAVAGLGALASACVPAAAPAVAALASSLAALEQGYARGAAGAAADVALLKAVRADGTAAYVALKLPTTGWENAPENNATG